MAFSEGQQVGPYQIIGQMGHGGMATIYKAYHARLDRPVAIKVMHQAFLEDQSFLARFEREARIVARLEHPNIVPIYDFADYERQPYLVMKFIEGETLKAVIDRGAPPLDEILRIMPRIADALDYAHRQGVLHRDIKPSNIILGSDGTPYLTDFGLARMAQLGQSTLSADMLVGTPNYISPEQAMGRTDLDSRTDIYSLGVVLYELIVGRVPFSADTPFAVIHDHIYRPLPAPSSVNPDVTPQVEAVLVKALAKTPADRYATATELIDAFRKAAAESHLALHPDRTATTAESMAQIRAAQDTALVEAPPARPPQPRETPRQPARDDANTIVEETPPPTQKPKRGAYPVDESGRRVEASFDFSMDNINRVLENAGQQVRNVIESGAVLISGNDDEFAPPDDENALRRRMERQFKKRSEFTGHLIAYVLVNALLWIIYFGSFSFFDPSSFLREFPWPLIVAMGWGSGLLAHFIDMYYQTGERAAARLRAIHGEFRRAYGDEWYAVGDRRELIKIRRRAEQPFNKRREFLSHLAVYIPINLMLWVIYFFSGGIFDSEIGFLNVGFPWPLIVMFGWGIGLVFHAVDVWAGTRQQRAIDRAVERERERYYVEKPKRDRYLYEEDDSVDARPSVRLNEDGEFTDSMIEEIDSEHHRRNRRRS